MDSYFTSDFFKGNRQKLRELFTGTAPIIVTANGLMQRNADTAFPFRQDSNFWYLTGIDEPDIVLVMDKNKEYLIVPERSHSRTVFDGAIDAAHLTERSGVATVQNESAGWKELQNRLKKVKHVATLTANATYVKSHGFYSNPARSALIQRIKEMNGELELLDVREHLMRLRIVKQTPEITAIEAAIDISAKAFKKIPRWLEKAETENAIEAEITKLFRKVGANHAYAPIVAGGLNACTLHYVGNNQGITKDSLLLVDAGAEVENYASDITRTFAVGSMTKRQRQVMEAVVEVQDYALEILKPGTTIHDYEKNIELFMGEKLRTLGLIKLVEHEEVRRYYPHATSHFLGLDVHDVGDYDRPLEAGNVLTVEPGIYIPEEGIGIRLEDNALITRDGNKVLSHKLPRMLE